MVRFPDAEIGGVDCENLQLVIHAKPPHSVEVGNACELGQLVREDKTANVGQVDSRPPLRFAGQSPGLSPSLIRRS